MTNKEYASLCKRSEAIANNHHRISEEICNKVVRDLRRGTLKTSWLICDNTIRVEKSEDCMMLYLWWHPVDQVRAFWKCVPNTYSFRQGEIEKMLRIQHWTCI